MQKKINVTFSIDEDIFFEFTQTVKRNNESRDVVLEKFMRFYVEENFPPPGPTNNWTKILLQKCQSKKIGWFVQNVLQKLLESGVATDWEVAEFKKAHNEDYAAKYRVPYGFHVEEVFNLSFPLIITADRKRRYDDPPKRFYKNSFYIGGEKYHLCSQWFVSQRGNVEEWIRKHLPIWLAQADEDSRNEMIRWIDSL